MLYIIKKKKLEKNLLKLNDGNIASYVIAYCTPYCIGSGSTMPSDLWWASGHCPMISKYGPSLSKAVGPVEPSFLVVKKSHINKNIHLTASL